jgi:hypothetical protein
MIAAERGVGVVGRGGVMTIVAHTVW